MNAAASSMGSVKAVMWNNIDEQLHAEHFQLLVGLIFLTAGKLMLYDGTWSFKLVSTSLVALYSYIFALSQIRISLGEGLGNALSVIVAAEIGLCAFVVMWKGFDAVKYALGALLGYFLSVSVIAKVAYHIGDSAASNQWFLLINWNICVALGLWLFHGGKLTRWSLDVVSAFFGGLFVASSGGYFLMVFASFMPRVLAKMNIAVDPNQPRGGYWVDYLYCIVDADKDFGIFINHKITLLGHTWFTNAIVGRGFWVFFFVVGIVISYFTEKRLAQAKMKQTGKVSGKKVKIAEAKPPAPEKEKKKGLFSKNRGNEKEFPLLG